MTQAHIGQTYTALDKLVQEIENEVDWDGLFLRKDKVKQMISDYLDRAIVGKI